MDTADQKSSDTPIWAKGRSVFRMVSFAFIIHSFVSRDLEAAAPCQACKSQGQH